MKKSWEVLRDALRHVGRKLIAFELNFSDRSIVDKWCEPPPSVELPEGSGVRNPLDVVGAILHVLVEARREGDAVSIVDSLCAQLAGTFVKLPPPGKPAKNLLRDLPKFLREVAAYIDSIAKAAEDGKITPSEAEEARDRCHHLVSMSMGFAERMRQAAEKAAGSKGVQTTLF